MNITKLLTIITFILCSSSSYAVSSVEKALIRPIKILNSQDVLFEKDIDYKITVFHKSNDSDKKIPIISKSFTYTKNNEIITKNNKNDLGNISIVEDAYKTALMNEIDSGILLPSELTPYDTSFMTGESKESPSVVLTPENNQEFVEFNIKYSSDNSPPIIDTNVRYTTKHENKFVPKYFIITENLVGVVFPFKSESNLNLQEGYSILVEIDVK